MILPTSALCARKLTSEFVSGTVRKEYVARVNGKFPKCVLGLFSFPVRLTVNQLSSTEVVCEEPLLTVDRQMGLNIVHPEGRSAKTVFTLIRYDERTDTSVVHCKPFTGRCEFVSLYPYGVIYSIGLYSSSTPCTSSVSRTSHLE